MGTIQKSLILFLFMAISLYTSGQDDKLTNQDADRTSHELYEKGDWKELIRFSKEAARSGIDDYNLRIRTGTAYFQTKRYMQAAIQFQKALEFNNDDFIAREYLYNCYLQLNRSTEAYQIFDKLPAASQEKFVHSLPKLKEAKLGAGIITSNQIGIFDTLDLDGPENIYGETDISQDGHYFSGGLKWGFKNGYDIFGSYSYLKIDKRKLARIGDTLSLDNQYPLVQHQLYVNGNIPLGKGYSLLPALNMVLDRFETVMPEPGEDSLSYIFPSEKFRYNTFIGYLSLTKDFNIIQTSFFAAYSNLNEKEQIQAGFQVTYLPFGNLNLYLNSKLLDHINESKGQIIFDQMVGFRLAQNWWAELDAVFGKMRNYHECQAYVVYDIAEEMKFKGSLKLIYKLGNRWIVTGEYFLLLREGDYFYYAHEDGITADRVNKSVDFNSQLALISFRWKF